MHVKLIAYVPPGDHVDIRPAPVEREWMEETDQRYAYRCLPLNIANAFGWEILCPSGFTAVWDGGKGIPALQVHPDGGAPAPAVSHFMQGILTFHVRCLFRTEPGYDLMVQGPINRPKDGIAPLPGVIETDWAPYPFTMNWIFTHPGVTVRFEQGEPYCHIFPIKRDEIETFAPELRDMSEDAELAAQYESWKARRAQFNEDLKAPGSEAQALRWQKHYYRGVDVHGRDAPVEDHRTRLRLKPFAEKR
jgi:hypothetical protein